MNLSVCSTCNLELWNYVIKLPNSHLSIYSDSRFYGRCLLVLDEHYEHLDEVPAQKLQGFMEDAQTVMKTLKAITDSERINFAVLGNAEPHVHAHLIPRYPEQETKPNSSPWDDPRDKKALSSEELTHLTSELFRALHM